MSKAILYFDTNVFLHFERIEHWPWKILFKADSIEIRITLVTINELNKHKDMHSVKIIRQRADSIIKRFHEIIDGNNSQSIKGIDYKFEIGEPKFDFTANSMNESFLDDRILASILIETKANPNARVYLVTNDVGFELKARANSITVLRPPEDKKLPNAKDELEKQIDKLKKENEDLRARDPKLLVTFHDDQAEFHISLPKTIPYLAKEHELKIQEIRTQYPELTYFPLKHTTPKSEVVTNDVFEGVRKIQIEVQKTSESLTHIELEDISKYNSALHAFYKEYDNYCSEKHTYDQIFARTFSIQFKVANLGKAPAEDLDLSLHLPDGFEVLTEDQLPEEPKRPSPPRKPLSAIERMCENLKSMSENPYRLSDLMMPYRSSDFASDKLDNVQFCNLKQTNSYEATYHITRLKHGFKELIGPLYLVFPDNTELDFFEIECGVHAANLPSPYQVSLRVKISKD